MPDLADSPGAYDDTPAILLDFHHSMLVDRVRTESFLKAVLAVVSPGDVVVDIGAGTGVLSLFAVAAGARKVYAIEQGAVAGLAAEVVEANGAADRIVIIEANSLEAELPEPADVLVTETIGNVGLEEGIETWVADARKRLLKPGAAVIPSRVAVMAALVDVPRDHREVSRWSQPLLGWDFSPLTEIVFNNILWADLSPAHLVSEPQPLIVASLDRPTAERRNETALRAQRDGTVHGIGVWFDATLCEGVTLSNSPPSRVPSWQQGFLVADEPLSVANGEMVPVELSVESGGSVWTWRVGDQMETRSTVYGRLDRVAKTED